MKENITNFFELNSVLEQLLISQQEFVMIDMPEILLRMRIGNMYSLAELNQIFNEVLNKVSRCKANDPTPDVPELAALYHFPEVFQKPRDEYMTALLTEIAQSMRGKMEGDEERVTGFDRITCYMGNIHVSPVTRLWRTNKIGSVSGTLKSEKRPDERVLFSNWQRGSSKAEVKRHQKPYKSRVDFADYISCC